MTQESLKYLENEPFCGYTDQIHPAKHPEFKVEYIQGQRKSECSI